MAGNGQSEPGRMGHRTVFRVLLGLLILSVLTNVFLLLRGRQGRGAGSKASQQGSESAEEQEQADAPMSVAVRKLIEADRSPGFYEAMASAMAAEKDSDAAIRLLAKAAAKEQEPFAKARLLSQLGKAQVKGGRTEDALSTYAQAVETSPDNKQKVSLSSTLGRLAERYGTPEQAIAAHEFVVESAEQKWVKDLSRRALLRLKEETGAIGGHLTTLEKRLEENPKDTSALESLVDYYRRQGKDYRQAIAYQERLVAIDPQNPRRVRDLGNICLEGKLYDRAAQVYKKALDADPKSAEYYIERLSRTYATKGDDKKARAWAIKLAESKPDDPLVLAKAAQLLAAAHDAEASLRWMEKAIAAATTDAQRAHLLLGAAGLADQLKKFDLAESYYRRTLEGEITPALRDRARRGLKAVGEKRESLDNPK